MVVEESAMTDEVLNTLVVLGHRLLLVEVGGGFETHLCIVTIRIARRPHQPTAGNDDQDTLGWLRNCAYAPVDLAGALANGMEDVLGAVADLGGGAGELRGGHRRSLGGLLGHLLAVGGPLKELAGGLQLLAYGPEGQSLPV